MITFGLFLVVNGLLSGLIGWFCLVFLLSISGSFAFFNDHDTFIIKSDLVGHFLNFLGKRRCSSLFFLEMELLLIEIVLE
jgi:hypothetical protein